MHSLKITHLNPGNKGHLESVLANKHFRERDKIVRIINIRHEGEDKYVDYILEEGEQANPL